MEEIAKLLLENKAVVIHILKNTSSNQDRDLAIIDAFIANKSWVKASSALALPKHIISSVVKRYAEKVKMSQLKQLWTGENLYSIGLNTRAVNCLLGEGIDSVDKLKNLTRQQIRKIPNCGRGTQRMIEQALSFAERS